MFVRDWAFDTKEIRAALLPSDARDMEIYRAGIKAGVRRFAWWKEGVQQVGTTGKTLMRALEEIDAEEKS